MTQIALSVAPLGRTRTLDVVPPASGKRAPSGLCRVFGPPYTAFACHNPKISSSPSVRVFLPTPRTENQVLRCSLALLTYPKKDNHINFIFKATFNPVGSTVSLINGWVLLQQVLETPAKGRRSVLSEMIFPPNTIQALLFFHALRYFECNVLKMTATTLSPHQPPCVRVLLPSRWALHFSLDLEERREKLKTETRPGPFIMSLYTQSRYRASPVIAADFSKATPAPTPAGPVDAADVTAHPQVASSRLRSPDRLNLSRPLPWHQLQRGRRQAWTLSPRVMPSPPRPGQGE